MLVGLKLFSLLTVNKTVLNTCRFKTVVSKKLVLHLFQVIKYFLFKNSAYIFIIKISLKITLSALDPGSRARLTLWSIARPSGCLIDKICNVYKFDSYNHILNIFALPLHTSNLFQKTMNLFLWYMQNCLK